MYPDGGPWLEVQKVVASIKLQKAALPLGYDLSKPLGLWLSGKWLVWEIRIAA